MSNKSDQRKVDKLLDCSIDNQKLENLNYSTNLNDTLTANSAEVETLLSELKNSFNKERIDQLFDQTKKDIIFSIAGPFGLGKVISAYDKVGGNVTTTHNFEKGVTATNSDKERYDEWQNSQNENLDRKPYDQKNFNSEKKKEKYDKMQEGEEVRSGYTNEILGTKKNDNIEKNQQIDLEHITSVKEIETDSANHLFAKGNDAEERQNDRVMLAQNDNNLTLIEGNLNSSKSDKDLMEWSNLPSTKDPSRTNGEAFNTDPELLKKEYEKSKDFILREQRLKQLTKQGKENLVSGATEGLKMGAQQAFGILLVELFSSSFTEIRNVFNKGLEGESLYEDIKKRLKRIGHNVASKWEESL